MIVDITQTTKIEKVYKTVVKSGLIESVLLLSLILNVMFNYYKKKEIEKSIVQGVLENANKFRKRL